MGIIQKAKDRFVASIASLDPIEKRDSRIFLWLWSLSFYLNYAESWKQPLITFLILAVCIATFFIRKQEWAWLLFLIFSTAILLDKLPILANHSFYTLFVNLYLLYRVARRTLNFDESLARPLRLSLAVVYLWAGLHKFNSDFLFFDESCAFNFMERINHNYFRGTLAHGLIYNGLLPISILLFEILLALLLSFKRTFYVAVTMALLFHAKLAALEFIDFSMIAISILVLSLLSFSAKKEKDSRLQKLRSLIPYYVITQFIMGLLSYFDSEKGVGSWGYWLQAGAYLMFSILLLYWGVPFARSKRKVNSVLPFSLKGAVFPLLVFLFGSLNYWGLSTAGTFSMFSNLRTEGASWNHFLFSRAMRIFHYQDDIYWVDQLDKPYQRTNKEHPRLGYGMPEIEFYRVLESWKARKKSPALVYRKNNDSHSSSDIASEAAFQKSPYSWLEMKLMYFRRIQAPGSPNKCRW